LSKLLFWLRVLFLKQEGGKEMSRAFKFIFAGLMVSLLVASGASALALGELANFTALDGAAGLIVNPEGKGDALIFPYYDVRNLNIGGTTRGQTTLFWIINESATGGEEGLDVGIIARIGFREWDKSIEVLDFSIYLSDEDVWIGQISLNPATGVANIKSPDYVVVDASATLFYLARAFDFTTAGQDFLPSNINYTPPPGVSKSDLTQMGYFEVIGQTATDRKPNLTSGTSPNTGQPYTATVTRNDALDCPNNLMGGAYILRVSDGVATGYNATALANFSRNLGSLFFGIATDQPTLSNAEDTLDQVEFVLSKEDIFGAYDIEAGLGASASLLITFPTKHFHYNNESTGCRTRIPGSNNPFEASCENGGEEIQATIWDRLENKKTIQTGFVSPQPPGDTVKLPYEVNIIGFYFGTACPTAVNSFFGTLRDNICFPTGTFDSGWVWIWFADPNPLNGQGAGLFGKWAFPVLIDDYQFFGNEFDQYEGLPSIALQIQEFSNGAAGGFYGDISEAWYEVEWFLSD
jgi:hypothetical protein